MVRLIWDHLVCSKAIYEALSKKNYKLIKNIRQLVQVGTLDALLGNRYYLVNGEMVNIDKNRLVQAIKRTKRVDFDVNSLQIHPESVHEEQMNVSTQYWVVDGDCLDAAVIARQHYGQRTVILNMASASNPGGGWTKGAGAQEENLCRRTGLSFCLLDPYELAFTDRESQLYPLSEYSCIYSKNVPCFRGSENEGYPFLERVQYLSIISSAAYRVPPTEGDNVFTTKWKRKWRSKVRMILKTVINEGDKILVLSAWGAGVYGNPPKEVAEAFHDVLLEPEFNNKLHSVIFAILEDHRSIDPKGNIIPFADTFNTIPKSLSNFQSTLSLISQ